MSQPSEVLFLQVPNSYKRIYPGTVVQLTRFNTTRFKVMYGWYSWGGNRPVCGWYLQREDNKEEIKPLQSTDLYDIYIIESGPVIPVADVRWEQV